MGQVAINSFTQTMQTTLIIDYLQFSLKISDKNQSINYLKMPMAVKDEHKKLTRTYRLQVTLNQYRMSSAVTLD